MTKKKLINQEIPNDEILYDLAEIFKVFGDTTRIKILYSLFKTETSVGDLADIVGITPSAVSHQLRMLKNNRLVKYRKVGQIVYYSLDDDHIKSIFDEGLKHVKER